MQLSLQRIHKIKKAFSYAFSSLALLGACVFLTWQSSPGQTPKSGVSAEQQKSANADIQSWVSIFPWGENIFEIQGDVRNSNIIYAATSHGLFRTSNAGLLWSPLYVIDATDLKFAQSRSSPNVMYAGFTLGSNGRMLKSTDGGTNWQQIGGDDIRRTIKSVQIDDRNPDLLYVITDRGGAADSIVKSLNGGRSWADISPDSNGGGLALVLDPHNGNHLMGPRLAIVESKDGGSTWQARPAITVSNDVERHTNQPWTANAYYGFGFDPHEEGVFSAIAKRNGWNSNHLLLSRDSGISWSDISVPETVSQFQSLANVNALDWSPKSPGLMYVGSGSSLYASPDYGRVWSRILPYSTRDILALASGDLYAATAAGVVKSRDGVRSWHLATLGLPTAIGVADCSLQSVDELDISVGCQTGFWNTSDGGLSWSWHAIVTDASAKPDALLPSGRGQNVRNLLIARDKTMYANLVKQSSEQLVKIQPDGKIVTLNPRDRAANSIGFSPAEPKVLYATAGDFMYSWTSPYIGKFLMKSDDAGSSWQTFDLARSFRPKNAGSSVFQVPLVAVAPESSKVVYALMSCRNRNGQDDMALLRTLDGGETWRDVFPDALIPNSASLPTWDQAGFAIAIDPKDVGTVYLGFRDGVYRSSDSGARWTRLPVKAGVIGDIAVNTESPQTLFVTVDAGTWMSRDSGATWSLVIAGLNQDKLLRIVSAGRVTVALGQRGIYRLTNRDMAWATSKWRDLEEKPEHNPISFPPVIVTTPVSAPSASAPSTPKVAESPRSAPPLVPAGSGAMSPTQCADFDACMGAGYAALKSNSWKDAAAEFQVAAGFNPASGSPWLSIGNAYLGMGQYDQLAPAWDKALQMGQTISVPVCHKLGGVTVRRCEEGTLSINASELAFTQSTGQKLFSAPPTRVKLGSVNNNSVVAVFTWQVDGKSFELQFVPVGVSCSAPSLLMCGPPGVAQEAAVATYLSHTIPKLATGIFTPTAPR